MADPIQLPLFPDAAALTRIRPERNEWRFYRLAVWPDLFGRALLARHWGRIATPGRIRLTRAAKPPGLRRYAAAHLDGARKYLTTGERDAFLRAAERADRQVRTLCMTHLLQYSPGRNGTDQIGH